MIPQKGSGFCGVYCDLEALKRATFWSPQDKSLTQADSPLFRLPLEIRRLIFREVWPQAIHIFAPGGVGPTSANIFSSCPCYTDNLAPDDREPQSQNLSRKEFRELCWDENSTWNQRSSSPWLNHWKCKVSHHGPGPRARDHRALLSAFLCCRQMYFEILPLAAKVPFTFTSPVETFCFLRRTPFAVARHIRIMNISFCLLEGYAKHEWAWLVGGIVSLESLRQISIWLQWGSPGISCKPWTDVETILKHTRRPFDGVKFLPHLSVRVSVPIDEVKPGDPEESASKWNERISVVRRGASHFRPAYDDWDGRYDRSEWAGLHASEYADYRPYLTWLRPREF